MKKTNKLGIMVVLLFSVLPQINIASNHFSNRIVMQEKRPRTFDTIHLWIGINELIVEINNDKKEDKDKIKPLARNEYTLINASEKITELGKLLKYDIFGSNNLLDCCKSFDSIIERYIKKDQDRDKFYLRVNNKAAAFL